MTAKTVAALSAKVYVVKDFYVAVGASSAVEVGASGFFREPTVPVMVPRLVMWRMVLNILLGQPLVYPDTLRYVKFDSYTEKKNSTSY